MGIIYGDWSLSPIALKFICGLIPAGSAILELGSGESTGKLAKHYKMFSIEEDEQYLNKYQSTYIHAPIDPSTNWYDRNRLIGKLPTRYDLLLVDGPSNIPEYPRRLGFINNLDLFDPKAIWVIDDLHRKSDFDMAMEIAKIRFKCPRVYPTEGIKTFGVFDGTN